MSARGLWSDGAETIIEGTSTVTLVRDAIDADHEARWFDEILRGVVWRQDHLVIRGERHAVPRLQVWMGDEGAVYGYSGLRLVPTPWIEPALALREVARSVAGVDFDSVLINRYRSGADALGWHSDDERELGTDPVIASVSLGATRRFRLRRRDDHATSISLDLPGGSVLVMAGRTQHEWEHCVPRTTRTVGERINLTFRRVAPA